MIMLIACEESQRVCIAFREQGHEAYSCDIVECSGGHPEWHIQHDVIPLLNGNCEFVTMDGASHTISGKWDMIIAFPPCTHLAVSGARHFANKRNDGRQKESIEFFCRILTANCDKIVVENPVNIIGGTYCKKWFPAVAKKYRLPIKPDQTIQPWMFGHPESKKTCLWLKGVPRLVPTNVLELPECGHWDNQTSNGQNKLVDDGQWLCYSDTRTATLRSKTYIGVALAMAEQWGVQHKINDVIMQDSRPRKRSCGPVRRKPARKS